MGGESLELLPASSSGMVAVATARRVYTGFDLGQLGVEWGQLTLVAVVSEPCPLLAFVCRVGVMPGGARWATCASVHSPSARLGADVATVTSP